MKTVMQNMPFGRAYIDSTKPMRLSVLTVVTKSFSKNPFQFYFDESFADYNASYTAADCAIVRVPYHNRPRQLGVLRATSFKNLYLLFTNKVA